MFYNAFDLFIRSLILEEEIHDIKGNPSRKNCFLKVRRFSLPDTDFKFTVVEEHFDLKTDFDVWVSNVEYLHIEIH